MTTRETRELPKDGDDADLLKPVYGTVEQAAIRPGPNGGVGNIGQVATAVPQTIDINHHLSVGGNGQEYHVPSGGEYNVYDSDGNFTGTISRREGQRRSELAAGITTRVS